jgi:hypothetical protein
MAPLLIALLAALALAPQAEAKKKTPTKLWYRTVVEFDGTLTRTITTEQSPPAPNAQVWERNEGPVVEEWASRWELGSNLATIITRRGNGRASIFSSMVGRMVSFTHTERRPRQRRFQYGVASDCAPYSDTGSLTGPAELGGIAGRSQRAGGGLGVGGVFRAGETLFSQTTGYSRTCTTTWYDRTYTSTSQPNPLRTVCCYFPVFYEEESGDLEATQENRPMGTEASLADKPTFGDDSPFTIKAKEFGKRIERRRRITHTYTVARPGSPDTTRYEWRYTYRFIFYPCPRAGRQSEIC